MNKNEKDETKIKAVVPAICPHCGNNIIIQYDIEAPKLSGILKLDQVDEEIRNAIENNDE